MTVMQALHHAYFFQAPNPTHHTKLPKSKASTQEVPEELPAAKDDDSKPSRKRKASGVLESTRQNVARRLDFTPGAVVSSQAIVFVALTNYTTLEISFVCSCVT